ncbi:DMT family transporter [Buchnera aphidicola (Mindarus keteleerifoliae)]|uniref:DMT family transporter n=1 Tax=Buchnera aphidicola TaxID=9 RepID=UPI0031B6BA09
MQTVIIISLFTLISFIWGTTWIAMKIATDTIPPLFATGFRFLLSFPILLIIAYFKKVPLFFPKGQKKFQFLISIFYFFLPFSLMLYAGSILNSVLASIIFSNMPVIVLISSIILLKEKIYFLRKLGIFTSMLSLILLLGKELYLCHYNVLIGMVALIGAMICHAIIYIQCKKKSYRVSIITFNTAPSLFSGLLLITISWFIESPCIKKFSFVSIISVFYLSTFVSIGAILMYFYLQKYINNFYASIVFLIIPIISEILEFFLYGKNISLYQHLFFIPTIVSVFLTLLPESFFKNNIFLFKKLFDFINNCKKFYIG